MKYQVVQRFTDAENGKVYDTGDKYPANAKKARIQLLLSDDVKDHENFDGPLIEEVDEEDGGGD